MKDKLKIKTRLLRAVAVCGPLILSGCHVQWVSPYSADLQKKATDMLSDVVAWEAHMRSVAGTAAADPRHPDVKAKFETWRGDIEAMSEIELSIDPGSTSCDAFIAKISGTITDDLKKKLPSTSAASSSSDMSITHCETLPDIFSKMMKQVADGASSDEGSSTSGIMQITLDQQCKMTWLSDDYFDTLQENRATSGASSSARPATSSAKAGTPASGQAADTKRKCRSLFEPPSDKVHGQLVDSLVTDLDAVIYREGRQAPSTSK